MHHRRMFIPFLLRRYINGHVNYIVLTLRNMSFPIPHVDLDYDLLALDND